MRVTGTDSYFGLRRHQLLNDDELGSLFDLLIDEAPQIRHAVGDLVYDHLIAQSSEGLLGYIVFN